MYNFIPGPRMPVAKHDESAVHEALALALLDALASGLCSEDALDSRKDSVARRAREIRAAVDSAAKAPARQQRAALPPERRRRARASSNR